MYVNIYWSYAVPSLKKLVDVPLNNIFVMFIRVE